jgi:MoxR-like ATPase
MMQQLKATKSTATNLDHMITGLPCKSSLAICLRGFSSREHTQAATLLEARGHRVVRSLGAAQFVIAGPDADDSLIESSRARGLKIAPWDAVRMDMDEDMASSSDDVALAPLASEPVVPLFREEDGQTWFLDLPLPSATDIPPEFHKHIPSAPRFAGLCFDQPFIETLHAVLTGTSYAMPVALEGETAASKTTAILYLAHRLRQPVVRLNLNGQTDAGELVGRFIPDNHGWAFQEAALPIAMRHGHWLLLDEMNLAEPQVLERLNSALENPPSLVISEGHGTSIGPGGDVAVSPQFRLLATLNPAEYSGRSILSPAFRNRWLIWHQAATPNEADILAMLRTLVFGDQPVVHWHGRAWQAAQSTPIMPGLADIPGIDRMLEMLALFHSTVARAASPANGEAPGLARHRRERDNFTRRNLLSTLQLVEAGIGTSGPDPRNAWSAAIHRIYINRYPDTADRRAIQSHARAAGLL